MRPSSIRKRAANSNAGQFLPAAIGVVPQRSVRACDRFERFRHSREIPPAYDNVQFFFEQPGVNAVADATEACQGPVLDRSGQSHAGGAAERRRACAEPGAVGGFLQKHRAGGLQGEQNDIGGGRGIAQRGE